MVLTSVVCAACLGQADPQTLLSEVRAAYTKVVTASMRVKFEVTDDHARRLRGDADVWILRPDHVKVVIKGLPGGTKTLWCNGKSVVTVGGKQPRRTETFSLNALSHDLPLNVETFAFLDSKHELSTEGAGAMAGSTLSVTQSVMDGRVWTVLEELNKKENSLDRYYIGKDDRFIWRVVDMSADGETVFSDTRVSGLKTGEPIPESLFEPSN